jgi:hypothetical protein
MYRCRSYIQISCVELTVYVFPAPVCPYANTVALPLLLKAYSTNSAVVLEYTSAFVVRSPSTCCVRVYMCIHIHTHGRLIHIQFVCIYNPCINNVYNIYNAHVYKKIHIHIQGILPCCLNIPCIRLFVTSVCMYGFLLCSPSSRHTCVYARTYVIHVQIKSFCFMLCFARHAGRMRIHVYTCRVWTCTRTYLTRIYNRSIRLYIDGVERHTHISLSCTHLDS